MVRFFSPGAAFGLAALALALPASSTQPAYGGLLTVRFELTVDARRMPDDIATITLGCELRVNRVGYEGRLVAKGASFIAVKSWGGVKQGKSLISMEIPDRSYEPLLKTHGGRYTCAVTGLRTTAAAEVPIETFAHDKARPTTATGVLPPAAWPYPPTVTVALGIAPPKGAGRVTEK